MLYFSFLYFVGCIIKIVRLREVRAELVRDVPRLPHPMSALIVNLSAVFITRARLSCNSTTFTAIVNIF